VSTPDMVVKNLLHLQAEGFRFLPGEPGLDTIFVYLVGYCSCIRKLGLPNDYVDFNAWLCKKEREIWLRGWSVVFLERSEGSRTTALQLFLAAAAEYMSEKHQLSAVTEYLLEQQETGGQITPR
jgi:hypothetical protein